MSEELPRMGHEVTICPDGATAVAALERNTYDCILVDLDMPRLNGLQVIARCKELSPETEAVVLTGKWTFESAVEALRYGAFDYLKKPYKLAELKTLLDRVAEKRELTNKCRALKMRCEQLEGGTQLIGTSPSMDTVRRLIAKVAPKESTVLILGETGTGKELVARALHEQSTRAESPFVAVNCGALPENLIESELFGHRKGSFTGADEQRVGLFEVANGGTIFLDEIGELPRSMQAKLLRVLESGEVRRVGDNDSFTVDVRVVCATHRDLEKMVAEGDFREDLMFRINTFEIRLPALRERLSDVPELARHLLRRFKPTLRPGDEAFTPEAIAALESHAWPGNVRELANVVEHAAILCDDGAITPLHLPSRFHERRLRGPHFKPVAQTATVQASVGQTANGPIASVAGTAGPNAQTLRELEMTAIHSALERHRGNKPKAAEELGISLKTLYNKLNQEQAETKETAS